MLSSGRPHHALSAAPISSVPNVLTSHEKSGMLRCGSFAEHDSLYFPCQVLCMTQLLLLLLNCLCKPRLWPRFTAT